MTYKFNADTILVHSADKYTASSSLISRPIVFADYHAIDHQLSLGQPQGAVVVSNNDKYSGVTLIALNKIKQESVYISDQIHSHQFIVISKGNLRSG